MPPWCRQEGLYSAPESFADDSEEYFAQGASYSWSAQDGCISASPITPVSTFSGTCISPSTFTFDNPREQFTPQWATATIGDWQPPFEQDELGMSSGSGPDLVPASKQQKNKELDPNRSRRHRGGSKKSTEAIRAQPPSPPTTPPEQRVGQLRTASRKAKRTSAHKPAASEEERRARASHNLVEKQYRNRLNTQFERLLAVLPPPGSEDENGGGTDDRRLSKAEVLDIARRRIKALERERDSLKLQKRELSVSVRKMQEAMVRGGQ